MNREDYSDATLVVLGHGTTQNPDSERPVFQHAAELRRRDLFREVREAFWNQPPQVKDVLAGLKASRVFIVPLFISEGYFATEVIPRELGFSNQLSINHQGTTIHYCNPVGSQSIERQVDLIRARQLYAAGHAVFMDETPRIQDCYSLAQTRNVVVVPFFISDGLHVVEDIPILLGEPERVVKERLAAGQPTWRNPTEKHGKLTWYSSAVGSDPLLTDVILERVREAARGPKL